MHQLAILLLLCYNLVASSQTIISSDQCLSAPCQYVGECRDKTGTCGDTTAHCNSESIWVPACGGGGGMYKPATLDSTTITSPAPIDYSAPPPPLMMPTMGTITAEPTTAWEAWVSGESDQDKGVIGLTTGNEGDGNYTQSNGTETWFNGDTWQNGRNETNKDENLLDKIDFWSNSDSTSSGSESRVEQILLWPLGFLVILPLLALF